jgi:hypothetical protein
MLPWTLDSSLQLCIVFWAGPVQEKRGRGPLVVVSIIPPDNGYMLYAQETVGHTMLSASILTAELAR